MIGLLLCYEYDYFQDICILGLLRLDSTYLRFCLTYDLLFWSEGRKSFLIVELRGEDRFLLDLDPGEEDGRLGTVHGEIPSREPAVLVGRVVGVGHHVGRWSWGVHHAVRGVELVRVGGRTRLPTSVLALVVLDR